MLPTKHVTHTVTELERRTIIKKKNKNINKKNRDEVTSAQMQWLILMSRMMSMRIVTAPSLAITAIAHAFMTQRTVPLLSQVYWVSTVV
tara:strand:- start:30 stop:296 length:267 start_codon:yes stop_codon:yes gene_type:complete